MECKVCGSFLLNTKEVILMYRSGKTTEDVANFLPDTLNVCCRIFYITSATINEQGDYRDTPSILHVLEYRDILKKEILAEYGAVSVRSGTIKTSDI